MYDAKTLEELMRIIIERGMSIDTEEGFAFKLHEHHPKAPRSPVKFNLATRAVRAAGRLTEDDVAYMGHALWGFAKFHHLTIPAIAGVPNVGEHLARTLQTRLEDDTGEYVPTVPMRKLEGSREIAPVEASPDYPPHHVVLAMDDVLTLGHSAVEAIGRLRQTQYVVKDFLVLLDYDLGGRDTLAGVGVNAHCLLSVESLMLFARDEKRIPVHYLEAMRRYYDAMRSFVRTLENSTPALAF